MVKQPNGETLVKNVMWREPNWERRKRKAKTVLSTAEARPEGKVLGGTDMREK